MIRRSLTFVLVGLLLSCAWILASSQSTADSVPEGFPFSVWLDAKQVTQIPWTVSIRDPRIRIDLRQELSISASIKEQDLPKNGDAQDMVFFARVLEGGRVVAPLYSVGLQPLLRDYFARAMAIVRPGKYKIELALLDRSTGRYNTRFEDLSVKGEGEPLERAFQTFSKFEFVAETKREDRGEGLPISIFESIFSPLNLPGIAGLARSAPSILSGTDIGFATAKPAFVVGRAGTQHLSVVAILNPPEAAAGDAYRNGVFENNLSNIMSVVTRLSVVRGTATFTGVDLSERVRRFDRMDLKDVLPESLRSAIRKDRMTISVATASGRSDTGRFVESVLKEPLTEAERDFSGAKHTIIVVSARYAFPNTSTPMTLPRNCNCQIFYVRFALFPNERDDIERLLRPLKPRVFEPLTWTEFREDFGKIYEELQP